MFKRKIVAFVITVLLSAPIVGFCFMLIERSTISEIPGLMIFTSMYAIPVTLLFGVPISILSDKMNARFIGKKRVFFSLAFHLVFGISFIVFFMLFVDARFILTDFNWGDLYFLVASTIYSFVGWGMDEILRIYFRKTNKEGNF